LENGAKLLGSAQRRIKNAVLQHGSLILQQHFPQQPSAQLVKDESSPVDLDELVSNVASHIAKQLRLSPLPSRLSAAEQKLLHSLLDKYHSAPWNRQR